MKLYTHTQNGTKIVLHTAHTKKIGNKKNMINARKYTHLID